MWLATCAFGQAGRARRATAAAVELALPCHARAAFRLLSKLHLGLQLADLRLRGLQLRAGDLSGQLAVQYLLVCGDLLLQGVSFLLFPAAVLQRRQLP